jgi:hypothetical protein
VSGRVRLTRGRLLAAGLAAGAPLALGPLRPSWHLLVERRPPEARLAALVGGGAPAIGSEFLRSRPDEAEPALLVAALAEGVPGGATAIAGAGEWELRAILSARSTDDFAAGRTVMLRGWILSETEARLCALAVLVPRRGRLF